MYKTKLTFYFKQANRKINGKMRRVWIKRDYWYEKGKSKGRMRYKIKMMYRK